MKTDNERKIINKDDYLHGYCHQWVLDNYKNGDKIFIITDYDYDIESEALVHCGIYRHNKYIDVRGEFDNIEDILDEFDYGENMESNIINFKEFKKYLKENNLLNECDVAPANCLTFGDVAGMGDIYFPDERGDKGSGDLPMPSGKLYKQVLPFDSFIKKSKPKKKKKGHFNKEDEPCVHPDNPPIYKHVDDYRTYAERTKLSKDI